MNNIWLIIAWDKFCMAVFGKGKHVENFIYNIISFVKKLMFLNSLA